MPLFDACAELQGMARARPGGTAIAGDILNTAQTDWQCACLSCFQPDRRTRVAFDTAAHSLKPHTDAARRGPAWGKIVAIALVIAALAAAWRYTPLSEYVNAERIEAWARNTGDVPWAPLVVMLAYTPACLVMFPRPLITLFAVLSFGAVLGFVYSIIGILGAALATYYLGRALRPRAPCATSSATG